MSDATDAPPRGADDPADEADPQRVLQRTRMARALADDESFGSVRVLSHEAAERVFTEKRREILRVLRDHEVDSQRELARLLDRDPGAVQRDLDELARADVVTVEPSGRSNRPTLAHDTVVVEPLVAPAVDADASYTVENEP